MSSVTSAQIDERAWVGPVGFEDPEIAAGKKFTFSVPVHNSGKSPAFILQAKENFDYFSPQTPFLPHYPGLVASTAILQPNATVFIKTGPSDDPMTIAKIGELKSRSIVIYIFGEIIYKDIFKTTRFARYCYILQPDLKTAVNCGTYNDAN